MTEDTHETEFDRGGRGFPNFGYRLRALERRVRDLEAHAGITPEPRNVTHYTNDRGEYRREDRRENRCGNRT